MKRLVVVGILMIGLSPAGRAGIEQPMGMAEATGLAEAFAPFWSTQPGFRTHVMLNNPVSDDLEVEIRVYRHSGFVESQQTLLLRAVESRTIDVGTIVSKRGYGHLALVYPAGIGFLPAQVLVSDGIDTVSFDFERREGLHFASANTSAVTPHAAATSVVLTNISESVLSGELIASDSQGSKGRSWVLPPKQTRLLKLPKGGSKDGSAAIDIVSGGESDGLLAAGLVQGDSGLLPVSFQGGVLESSGELAGFWDGGTGSLLLRNLGVSPFESTICLRADGTQRCLPQLLAPGGASEVDLSSLAPSGPTRGVVTVQVPQGKRVAGWILTGGRAGQIVSLRDTLKETNPAYSFGVRLGEALSSQIFLFNPNPEETAVCLFLYFGEERYIYPLKHLDGLQSVRIDLLQAQRDRLPGEMGGTIPEGSLTGQAKVIMHGKEGMKNLLALGSYQDTQTGDQVSVQGCFSCEPGFAQLEIVPDPIEGYVTQTKRFSLLGHFWDGASKYLSFGPTTPPATTDDGRIAQAYGTRVDLLRAGSTRLRATHQGCVDAGVDEFSQSGTRLGCQCRATSLFEASSRVRVDPERLSIVSVDARNPVETKVRYKLEPADLEIRNLRFYLGSKLRASLGSASGTFSFTFNQNHLPKGATVLRLTYSVGASSKSAHFTATRHFSRLATGTGFFDYLYLGTPRGAPFPAFFFLTMRHVAHFVYDKIHYSVPVVAQSKTILVRRRTVILESQDRVPNLDTGILYFGSPDYPAWGERSWYSDRQGTHLVSSLQNIPWNEPVIPNQTTHLRVKRREETPRVFFAQGNALQGQSQTTSLLLNAGSPVGFYGELRVSVPID